MIYLCILCIQYCATWNACIAILWYSIYKPAIHTISCALFMNSRISINRDGKLNEEIVVFLSAWTKQHSMEVKIKQLLRISSSPWFTWEHIVQDGGNLQDVQDIYAPRGLLTLNFQALSQVLCSRGELLDMYTIKHLSIANASQDKLNGRKGIKAKFLQYYSLLSSHYSLAMTH